MNIRNLQSYQKLLKHSADIRIPTDTPSRLSSACIVLALVASRLDIVSLDLNSQQQTLQWAFDVSGST